MIIEFLISENRIFVFFFQFRLCYRVLFSLKNTRVPFVSYPWSYEILNFLFYTFVCNHKPFVSPMILRFIRSNNTLCSLQR